MRSTLFLCSIAILCLGCTPPGPSEGTHDQRAVVSVQAPSKSPIQEAVKAKSSVVETYDLKTLERSGAFRDLKKVTLKTLNDPAYDQGPKTFVGYDLKEVLQKLKGFDAFDTETHALRFVCTDGYRTTFSFESLEGKRGLLATSVQGATKGEWFEYLDGKQRKTPSPFYLVWADEAVSKDRPWPYQLTSIEVISKAMLTDLLRPGSAKYEAGQKLFEARCMACHSINLVGGAMGPEFNVPQNLCEYRTPEFLRNFIKSPQSFRAGSTMPPMPYLTNEQLDSLLGYVCHMSSRKACLSTQSCAKLSAERR